MASRLNRTMRYDRSHPVKISCALRQGRLGKGCQERHLTRWQDWSGGNVRECNVRERDVLDNVG